MQQELGHEELLLVHPQELLRLLAIRGTLTEYKREWNLIGLA